MAVQRLEGRNGEVWTLWSIHRWNETRIAEHFGISQQRVSQLLADVKAEMRPIQQDELAQQSMELLAKLQQETLDLVEKVREGAPVAVGKDGNPLLDPVTGEYVRDYSGLLAAVKAAKEMDAEIAKRFGLNAPERRELDVKGTINYSVAGIDPEADLK
jgi:antitoxin (DNA-binding transcriptional repressor) of toxin-antitoxin stability system